jgi:flagellar protein FlaJ
LDKLAALSFRLFGKASPFFLKKVFPQLKGQLERARVKIYPETYISLMFFIALLTVPVSVIGLFTVLTFNFLPLLILVFIPLFVIAGFIVVPMNNASDRSIGIERELPFSAAYISIMSSGGIAPYDSFKRLTEVNLMPAMSKEARDIVKDVEIFGTDPLTALEQAAKKTPLDLFREFLGGYASTVIIGGDKGYGIVLHGVGRKISQLRQV